jgi:integrase/recombinase XerD
MLTLVESYLALRRSLGFKLAKTEQLLRAFAAFSRAHGQALVRSSLAVEWAGQSSSARQRSCRLKAVVAFARHLRAEDPHHQLPPAGLFPFRRRRRIPHIFSADEIRILLAAALRLPPRGSLRPQVFHTLFALLACTGLRISEALRLRYGHLTADGLVIEATKFRKSRLVPLHPTTTAALSSYLRRRRRVQAVDDHLFIGTTGMPLRLDNTNRVFLRLLREQGLRDAPPSPGPHLHDMRHTFAVRTLEATPSDRAGVGRHMVALSTYLGHAQVSDTYWYLHVTPCLMRAIGDASRERLFGGRP